MSSTTGTSEDRPRAHEALHNGTGTKPTIVKVTYFVTSAAAAQGPSHPVHRTQVWLSIALQPTTTPRDIIVAAFKHAIERLGGAKLDAHPAKMMIFLQSHGEFIKLDAPKQPLLEYDAVLELVRHEGKHVVTTALVSEAEFLRYNKQSNASLSEAGQSTTSTQRSGGAASSDTTSPLGDGMGGTGSGTNGNGGGFQFRGRSRAASILPDALGHDPLADKRIRGKPNNAASSPSTSPPADHLTTDRGADDDGHGGVVSNDSFMLPASMSPRGPQLGKCRVEFVTPVGTRMAIVVEYPLGLLCHNVVDMAVAQLRSGAKATGREWELDEGLLDVTDALTLVYRDANGSHRRFGRDEVLPVSRGQRDDIVNVFLSVDRSLLVSSLAQSRGSSREGAPSGQRKRGDSVSSLGSTAPTRPASVLRIAGTTASLHGVATARASGDSFLHPDDVSACLKTRMDAHGVALRPPMNDDGAIDMSSRVPDGDETATLRTLLQEETNARIHLVAQQLDVAVSKRAQAAVDDECKAAMEEEQRHVARCHVLQQAIGEAKSAERDIARLEELVEWFQRDVETSKERQRDMTRELFELSRPPLQAMP